MATSFGNVYLGFFDENCQFKSKSDSLFTIDVSKDSKGALLQFRTDGQSLQCVYEERHDVARVGKQCLTLSTSHQSLLLKFPTENDMKSFHHLLKQLVSGKTENVFDDRTDEASASQYFQFYGFLSQQQNMMQDYIRTSTYQRAMLSNVLDFHDKVILDVGAGSGILSFFAVQSGAAKVYAIEASSMALHCETLVRNNKLSGRIIVLPGKVEEIELPEKVDVIISEPMGYMLFNERMLESYLHAKKWLKPGGKMFPTVGDLHISPFTDDALYMEQFSKANFWYQQSFHGVDLASLREAAVKEYFKQPIVDTFDIRICMARSYKYTVNFQTAHETDLHHIDIPVTFSMLQSGTVHGLAFWFDVAFLGSGQAVWLSTSPTEPLTHWYQVRCLLQQPVFVKQGQTVTGRVVLKANKRQSYDVDIEIDIPGTNSKTVNNLDLKNPFFRYTGQQPAAPPGNTTASPSEAYWNTLATVNSQVVYNVLNGYLSAGDATHGVVQNNLIPLEQQHYMSGMVNGMTGVSLQQGVDHQNLIGLSNTAPINPGSIPSVGNYTSQANLRTSIGAGISPAVFQQQNLPVMSSSFPVSNQFMIGDYALQGTNMVTSQIQGAGDYKN